MNAVVRPERRPRNPGVALAMSGGGYRASLFHLGSLRRLAELGVLDQIQHFSSVSGGSITCGLLAADLIAHPVSSFQNRVNRIDPTLRDFCSKTIDTGTILSGVLTPFRGAAEILTKKYQKLYRDYKLSQLPQTPLFTFCSTNMQTGRLVHLTRQGIYDYRIGETSVQVPLAMAVAASSAFPPFLSPVVLDCKGAAWRAGKYSTLTADKDFTGKLYLTDGGAYDNMGLEPVWDEYETVLVSDAGAPYKATNSFRSNWFSQLNGVFEIATDQARGVRKRWLVQQLKDKNHAGTYWGIATDILKYEVSDSLSVAPSLIARVSAMRTRLNQFSEEEQELLINWGYAVTDAAMRRWCAPLCTPSAPTRAWPHPGRAMS